MDVLTGQFTKKIYGQPNGKYHVYQFSYNGKRCTATLRGTHTPSMESPYILTGHWVTNPKYGPQFEISHIERYKTNQERGNDYIKHIKGMLVA